MSNATITPARATAEVMHNTSASVRTEGIDVVLNARK